MFELSDYSGLFELLVILFTIHFFYDFSFQGRMVAENKGKYSVILLVHCFTLGALLWLAKFFWDGSNDHLWLLILIASHFITDRWKMDHITLEWQKRNLIDQGLHLLTIIYFGVFG